MSSTSYLSFQCFIYGYNFQVFHKKFYTTCKKINENDYCIAYSISSTHIILQLCICELIYINIYMLSAYKIRQVTNYNIIVSRRLPTLTLNFISRKCKNSVQLVGKICMPKYSVMQRGQRSLKSLDINLAILLYIHASILA